MSLIHFYLVDFNERGIKMENFEDIFTSLYILNIYDEKTNNFICRIGFSTQESMRKFEEQIRIYMSNKHALRFDERTYVNADSNMEKALETTKLALDYWYKD